jgi:membrane protease YdiL (CAAX protease family)
MLTLNPKKQAGIEIILFVIVTYGLSYALLNWALIYFLSSTIRGFFLTWGLFLQMWIPGTTSIIFRIIFKRGFNDIGWKIGNRRFWWLAILIPFSVPLVSYLIVFFAGNATLTLMNFRSFIYQDPLKLFTLYWPTSIPRSLGIDLFVRSIVVLTIGLAVNFVFAFGEELGWRGYLQQRIIDTKFKYPYALCGLIWAGWHFPFLWYLYNPASSQLFQILFFVINIVFLGIIIGHLRMDSESIWIPTMVHAAHNAFNFELFAAVFLCGQCELYIGENGIIMGIIYGLIVVWMLRPKKFLSYKNIISG